MPSFWESYLAQNVHDKGSNMNHCCSFLSSGEVHPDSLPYQLCRGTVVALLWSTAWYSHPCRCATSFGLTGILLEGSGWRVSWPRARPAGSWRAHLQLCQEIWKRKEVMLHSVLYDFPCSKQQYIYNKMNVLLQWCRWLMSRSWRPCVLKSPPSTIQVKAQSLQAGPAAPLPTSLWLVKRWSFVREGAASLSGTVQLIGHHLTHHHLKVNLPKRNRTL